MAIGWADFIERLGGAFHVLTGANDGVNRNPTVRVWDGESGDEYTVTAVYAEDGEVNVDIVKKRLPR